MTDKTYPYGEGPVVVGPAGVRRLTVDASGVLSLDPTTINLGDDVYEQPIGPLLHASDTTPVPSTGRLAKNGKTPEGSGILSGASGSLTWNTADYPVIGISGLTHCRFFQVTAPVTGVFAVDLSSDVGPAKATWSPSQPGIATIPTIVADERPFVGYKGVDLATVVFEFAGPAVYLTAGQTIWLLVGKSLYESTEGGPVDWDLPDTNVTMTWRLPTAAQHLTTGAVSSAAIPLEVGETVTAPWSTADLPGDGMGAVINSGGWRPGYGEWARYFTFTPTVDGFVTLDTMQSTGISLEGESLGTSVVVFTAVPDPYGTDFAGESGLVGAIDNTGAQGFAHGGPQGSSYVHFSATAGTQYWVLVGKAGPNSINDRDSVYYPGILDDCTGMVLHAIIPGGDAFNRSDRTLDGDFEWFEWVPGSVGPFSIVGEKVMIPVGTTPVGAADVVAIPILKQRVDGTPGVADVTARVAFASFDGAGVSTLYVCAADAGGVTAVTPSPPPIDGQGCISLRFDGSATYLDLAVGGGGSTEWIALMADDRSTDHGVWHAWIGSEIDLRMVYTDATKALQIFVDGTVAFDVDLSGSTNLPALSSMPFAGFGTTVDGSVVSFDTFMWQ